MILKSLNIKRSLPQLPAWHLCLLFILSILFSNCGQVDLGKPLFEKLSARQTQVNFNNKIVEDEKHNILNFTNLYTGAGVGIGDFNQDGWPDLFFGANMLSSCLYLNQGQEQISFEDVTALAGVTTDRWVMGVTVVDINADGWPDIYLSVSGNAEREQRKNLLFVNQKNNTFLEKAEVYGIADTAQCTHANFLDYDQDGDLDLFLIVNPTDYELYNVNKIRKRRVNGEARSTDKLYRNNGDLTFTDVSREAGILIEGYGLSVNVSDLNNDHWPDIYVTNDFLTNDILYINNQDGTFTNRAADMLKHTSFASMGIDVADINNDGQPEIYVLDMFPEDNYRQKMIMAGGNYDRFQYILKHGYEPQYSRNTLQLNNGDGTFSEIGQLAEVHRTDWSWSALLADYDNDGWRDLFVTNGFRRDLGNLDYINYNNSNSFGSPESRRADQLASIVAQPGAKLLNYIYQNNSGKSFEKKNLTWGLNDSTYSHGAAYADLDNDGDLDLVVNNVEQLAGIYENRATENKNHYLKIKLVGTGNNTTALGAKVWLKIKDQILYQEKITARGYTSTVDDNLHFGLGASTQIDSLIIRWPNGGYSFLSNPPIDTLLSFANPHNAAEQVIPFAEQQKQQQKIFSPSKTFDFKHQEDLQIDFKAQPLLPHQHSRQGPALAKGDVNRDGKEDLFIGGAAGTAGQFFIHQSEETFEKYTLTEDEEKEDVAATLFDADGDGDLDLYVVSGGVVYSSDAAIYEDRIYMNDGAGHFSKSAKALPILNASGSCVVPCDYDQDGDLDLFVGGRVVPQQYPTIPESYLLENQNGVFKIITPAELAGIGMVSDALWTDFDQDGDADLMVVGEFMPITFFVNEKGKLSDAPLEIKTSSGWWNSLAAGDFDGDGDTDYLAGNLGLNTNHRASARAPLCLYAKDFDNNGKLDPVLCHFFQGKEYTVTSRDMLIQQIPALKGRFNNYEKFARAPFSQVWNKAELKDAQILQANFLQTSYLENLGKGQFSLRPLPLALQMAPIQDFLVNDFLVNDFNGDGILDALAVGNSFATEVFIGRYDAFTGALLLGKGDGSFDVMRGAECGLLANRDARAIIELHRSDQEDWIIIGNNSDSLQTFVGRQTDNTYVNNLKN